MSYYFYWSNTDLITQNADLIDEISTKVFTLSTQNKAADNIDVGAQNYANGTISASRDGYTPIGIVGYNIYNATSSGTSSSRCSLSKLYLSGETITYQFVNYYTSAAKVAISATVLYMQD